MKTIQNKSKLSYKDTTINILNGAKNLIQNNNKDIADSRLSICKSCPLYKLKGPGNIHICDSTQSTQININWFDKNTTESGTTSGCGCLLESKSTVIGNGNTCPALKWNESDILHLSLMNSDYIILNDNGLISNFMDQVRAVGITMAAYSSKYKNTRLTLVRRLISHSKLLTLNYTHDINIIDGEIVIVYIKNIAQFKYTVNCFINGTYSIILTDKNKESIEILSRKESLRSDINELLILLSITTEDDIRNLLKTN